MQHITPLHKHTSARGTSDEVMKQGLKVARLSGICAIKVNRGRKESNFFSFFIFSSSSHALLMFVFKAKEEQFSHVPEESGIKELKT